LLYLQDLNEFTERKIHYHKSYYTGHTDNIENRLYQHQSRMVSGCYTSTRLPIQLKYSQAFLTREEALSAEKRIKGWSRRKKEALMKNDWRALSDYAKRRK
jgi:putative endonuclease